MTKSFKLIKVPGVSCCVQNNCKKNVKKTSGNFNYCQTSQKGQFLNFEFLNSVSTLVLIFKCTGPIHIRLNLKYVNPTFYSCNLN